MDIKPNIFIGSSREGLHVAELVKKHLSDFADCRIWNDQVFKFNSSYFETLMELLNFYDYGIMVGTADDLVVSRDQHHSETRDNVLFELGLFLGRLGKEKVFFLKAKNAKTPSDLSGISIPEFSETDGPALEAEIQQRCEEIINQIRSRTGIFDGGLFPSVPLAYGYFFNSLLPACRQLLSTKTVKINGTEHVIDSFHFSVLIPDDLRSDMKEKVEVAKLQGNWVQLEIPTSATRSYNFYIASAKLDHKNLEISDIPTTLNSLYQTIKEFAGSGKIGVSLKEQLIERREIAHFQKVVEYLINSSPYTKGRITTEIVDI